MELDEILDRLDRYHQRATFGAVAGVLGVHPLFLMKDAPRGPRHSWVVNEETHRPPDYPPELIHPQHRELDHVIEDAEELSAWLDEHPEPMRTLTLEIPESVYRTLARLAEEAGWSPERWSAECLRGSVQEIDQDPLARMAGCLAGEVGDASREHDYWFGHALAEDEEAALRGRDG